MSTSTILILGVTGYIGGSILTPFKQAFPSHKIVATIRSEKQAAVVRAAGVDETIIASFEELDKMRDAASNADIVINGASADDLALVKALIEGLKIKAQKSKEKPVLIHTSGTGVIYEQPDGQFVNSKEYDDISENDIRGIDPKALHRDVDLEVFKADSEGIISAYIICPPTIYGTGTGPGHRTTIQVPLIVGDALQRKRAAYVGPGKGVWDNTHIDDIAQLYVLVAQRALSSDAAKDTTPYSKFYFVGAARHEWGDVTRQIGDILFARKLVDSPGAISVPMEQAGNLLYVSSTARAISSRAKSLGWKPTKPSLSESLEAEVDEILKGIK